MMFPDIDAVALERPGHVDEVRERVHLVHQAALLVPLAPHLLSAADVRNDIDEPPVQQADDRVAEPRVRRGTVGSVGVLQRRC